MKLRNPQKIVEVLAMKLRYAREEEEELKRSYIKEKKDLERRHVEAKKERKFRRIVKRIQKQANERWEKGLRKNEETVKCIDKFKGSMPTSEFQEWVKRMQMAQGTGKESNPNQ